VYRAKRRIAKKRKHPKRTPAADDELTLLRGKYLFPKDEREREALVAYLASRRFLLSYLVCAADELLSRFYDLHAFLRLELTGGRLCVFVQSEMEMDDYYSRVDEFVTQWVGAVEQEMENVHYDVE